MKIFALEILHLISIDESAYQTMLIDSARRATKLFSLPFVEWPVMYDLLSQKAALALVRKIPVSIVSRVCLLYFSPDCSVWVYFVIYVRLTVQLFCILRLLINKWTLILI